MHESWSNLLGQEVEKPYFKTLVEFVHSERMKHTVYPPRQDVFTALGTPFDSVKVVILGQDPYHGPGQAHGLSFSVRKGVTVPPSLANIYRELQDDVGFTHPGHGCLSEWSERGVLLLNTVLTVRAHEPASHQGRGWETFTDSIIRRLSARPQPCIFILWGRQAREKKELIDDRHTILESAHPSPMSAANGFFGSRPFSKANAALRRFDVEPIDWSLAPV